MSTRKRSWGVRDTEGTILCHLIKSLLSIPQRLQLRTECSFPLESLVWYSVLVPSPSLVSFRFSVPFEWLSPDCQVSIDLALGGLLFHVQPSGGRPPLGTTTVLQEDRSNACLCQWHHPHPSPHTGNYELNLAPLVPFSLSSHQYGQVMLTVHCKSLFHFSPFSLSLPLSRPSQLYT